MLVNEFYVQQVLIETKPSPCLGICSESGGSKRPFTIDDYFNNTIRKKLYNLYWISGISLCQICSAAVVVLLCILCVKK